MGQELLLAILLKLKRSAVSSRKSLANPRLSALYVIIHFRVYKRFLHWFIVLQVKTNLGHSEAASGISSIIKAVLAFEHGKIPPTMGITELNPKSTYVYLQRTG